VCGAAPRAQVPDQGDGWKFSVTPYLWLPNINGTLAFTPPSGGAGPDVGVGPADWLQHLNAVAMIAGDARKGRWSVLTDVIYLDFANQRSRVKSVDFGIGPAGRIPVSADTNLNTRSSLSGGVWMLATGYQLQGDPDASYEVYGGVRHFGVKASVDWQLASTVTLPGSQRTFASSGTASQKNDLWDGIVGVRGRVRLGTGKWFVPYALDMGTGSSNFTWQAYAALGYAYGWGDLLLSYRHLSYDMDSGKLLQDMRFSGPALAVTFRF
jgi:hypothetical protein